MLLDGMADIAEVCARAHPLDGGNMASGRSRSGAVPDWRLAHVVHPAGIADSCPDDRHVDIEQITALEHSLIGIPWQTTWLTEVHTVLGSRDNPFAESSAGP
jgi:hypothetical protein